MTRPLSVKGAARRAVADEKKAQKATAQRVASNFTADSFVNFQQKMGVGADNALSTASYGFNPITRIRTVLEWMHRGSWLAGMAIDIPAEDMTRAGVDQKGEIEPEDIEVIDAEIVRLGVWNKLCSAIKWGRLYGGSIAVLMVDGQKYDTPLRLETIGPDGFQGLLVLDRWMVDASVGRIVQTPGPDLGQPEFYTVLGDAPALRSQRIHHSRCIRFGGIELPYWQKVMENLWDESVLERLYDRMVAFDSASTGAAQLVYKAYIRTYAIEDLRAVIAQGGPALTGLVKYVEMMRRFQGVEGITLIDAKDKMEAMQHSAFSGLSDVMLQFGQQLSGALGIPLVRLFGQSPAGLNATGESDLRLYYDSIQKQQNKDLTVGITKIYKAVAQSKKIKVPKDYGITFRSLWQLTDKEKADIAETIGRAVAAAEEGGLLTQAGAMKELKQSSHITGIFTNIEDEDIRSAATDLPPAGAEAAAMAQEAMTAAPDDDDKPGKKPGAKDSIASVAGMKQFHDLDVLIESPKGSLRRGQDSHRGPWEAKLAADYGYIRRTVGSDQMETDCFVGPNPASDKVWIIDQYNIHGPLAGNHDEYKVMLGFDRVSDAVTAYVMSFSDNRGLSSVGNLLSMDMAGFKDWLGTQTGGQS